MSNHFAKPSIGIQNVSSCVSNHSQHAAGLGRAIKTYRKDAIVFCSIGESSTSEGYFYEAVNGASREKLPVVFVVQDNGYGISVPKSDQTANLYASDNFTGFKNLKIIHCDGLDVFDSFRAMREAIGVRPLRRRRRDRPRDAASASTRTPTPTARSSTARRRSSPRRSAADPLPRFRKLLLETGLLTEEELRAIEAQNERTYEEAADRAEGRAGARPRDDPRLRRARALGPRGVARGAARRLRRGDDRSSTR